MNKREASTIAPTVVANDLTLSDLFAVLRSGARDFAIYPLYGLFFSAFYAVGGALLFFGLVRLGLGWWMIPAMVGFPIIAPFIAVGMYEVSRRREVGLPLNWSAVLGALRGKGDDQLILMGGIVFVAFSFWMILAHGIFAIFMGETEISQTGSALIQSSEAISMLLVGSVIGGFFALALFAITVMTLPMLVDKDVDFISAIIVSLATMRANRGVMLAWALLIALILFVAMLPLFLGLLIALPVLGHASWHLYRRVVGS